jgi:NADH dehydrogenase [ubiquinone] 1 alpha subcomplex assembly factor 5
MNIFDRKTKIRQKEIASANPDFEKYLYIKEEFGHRLADRVFDIKKSFDVVIDVGCGRGHVSKHLFDDVVRNLVLVDPLQKNLDLATIPDGFMNVTKVLGDEEGNGKGLPFEDNYADLIISCLNLHWVNDLPAVWAKFMSILKPDGVVIGNMFAGETLYELRSSLYLAESEREGGFSPHISPFIRPQDLGGLLNRAGFNMITIDHDELVVRYPSMIELMYDLKGMGENNCSWNRKNHLHRETILSASAIYQEMYGSPQEAGIPATFQVLSFIGWKPHESQPKPASRGSATFSLKDIKDLDKITKKVPPKS